MAVKTAFLVKLVKQTRLQFYFLFWLSIGLKNVIIVYMAVGI